jgi:cytochrome c553
MSLRNQPLSERIFATFVVLALAVILTGGLVFTLRQDPGGTTTPAARPRLLAALDGIMAPNVSAAETDAFRVWVQNGATREGFGPVAPIVAGNCTRCHGPGGQSPRIASFEDLRPLALDQDLPGTGIYAMIGDRALHLALFPLVFLVAVLGFLRRTTWGHRWGLAAGCAAAVLCDLGGWWLNQGQGKSPGIAWVAAGALTVAMLTLVAVVLRELWRPEVS